MTQELKGDLKDKHANIEASGTPDGRGQVALKSEVWDELVGTSETEEGKKLGYYVENYIFDPAKEWDKQPTLECLEIVFLLLQGLIRAQRYDSAKYIISQIKENDILHNASRSQIRKLEMVVDYLIAHGQGADVSRIRALDPDFDILNFPVLEQSKIQAAIERFKRLFASLRNVEPEKKEFEAISLANKYKFVVRLRRFLKIYPGEDHTIRGFLEYALDWLGQGKDIAYILDVLRSLNDYRAGHPLGERISNLYSILEEVFVAYDHFFIDGSVNVMQSTVDKIKKTKDLNEADKQLLLDRIMKDTGVN